MAVDGDQIYAWAEQAVEEIIVDLRPDLKARWRGVSPKNVGQDPDNWLVTSARMIRGFNQLAQGIHPITMSEPARVTYHAKPLISFVTAIADLGDQVL
jgi:hypothetical protein